MTIESNNSKETRAANRLKTELKVYYGSSRKKSLSGFSVDLSAGGIYFCTDNLLEIDEELTLTFSIPGDEKKAVSCKARVAWVNTKENQHKPDYPPGMGVEFLDLAQEDLDSLVNFIDLVAAW